MEILRFVRSLLWEGEIKMRKVIMEILLVGSRKEMIFLIGILFRELRGFE